MNIKEKVHSLYWEKDVNCARTMLSCLGERFGIEIAPQTYQAAAGLHGAGGYGAQCGLTEGGLMFMGIYMNGKGALEEDIVKACYRFADRFTARFGSLSCSKLRPGGFRKDDPPHACEKLTCEAVAFAVDFIENLEIETNMTKV